MDVGKFLNRSALVLLLAGFATSAAAQSIDTLYEAA